MPCGRVSMWTRPLRGAIRALSRMSSCRSSPAFSFRRVSGSGAESPSAPGLSAVSAVSKRQAAVLSSVSFPSLGRNLRPAPVRNAAEGSVCREGLRQTADAMSCESGIPSVFRGQLYSRTAAGREQTLFSAVFSLRPVQCYCIYMALCVSCNELNERPWEYLVCGNMPCRYC